jgi:hypothetical protein
LICEVASLSRRRVWNEFATAFSAAISSSVAALSSSSNWNSI